MLTSDWTREASGLQHRATYEPMLERDGIDLRWDPSDSEAVKCYCAGRANRWAKVVLKAIESGQTQAWYAKPKRSE